MDSTTNQTTVLRRTQIQSDSTNLPSDCIDIEAYKAKEEYLNSLPDETWAPPPSNTTNQDIKDNIIPIKAPSFTRKTKIDIGKYFWDDSVINEKRDLYSEKLIKNRLCLPMWYRRFEKKVVFNDERRRKKYGSRRCLTMNSVNLFYQLRYGSVCNVASPRMYLSPKEKERLDSWD